MSQHYYQKQFKADRRKSLQFAVSIVEEEEEEEDRRLSVCLNAQRRLSTISQIYLPHGIEYHGQERLPPSGPEAQQTLILTTDENSTIQQQRKLSINQQIDSETVEEDQLNNKTTKRILFLLEPMISGLILFPILVLFWQTGWNLILILFNLLNGFSPNFSFNKTTQDDNVSYDWKSLFFPYLIVELVLLLVYLLQDLIYWFLKRRQWLLAGILLKCHILLLSIIYIVQWESLWTIWDEFTPSQWYFQLSLSVGSLFALIVVIGHLSDLIYSPFLVSYDSVEYSILFGCPLLTRQVWLFVHINLWKSLFYFLEDESMENTFHQFYFIRTVRFQFIGDHLERFL